MVHFIVNCMAHKTPDASGWASRASRGREPYCAPGALGEL